MIDDKIKMDKKSFPLGLPAPNRFEKIIRIIFGLVCIAIAVFWFNFNIKALKADGTLWITVVFLIGFGLYQIWAGLGRTVTYIEISAELIKLKKNPVFPAFEMKPAKIEKIELFPLSLVFYLNTRKKYLLRFGTTFQDINENIKDEILKFCDLNNIPIEIIEEKI